VKPAPTGYGRHMPREMITTATEDPHISRPHTAQPAPAEPDTVSFPDTFSFVDIEHGDPDGTDIEAAVASWDGFL
jgi:hypothetical protein